MKEREGGREREGEKEGGREREGEGKNGGKYNVYREGMTTIQVGNACWYIHCTCTCRCILLSVVSTCTLYIVLISLQWLSVNSKMTHSLCSFCLVSSSA